MDLLTITARPKAVATVPPQALAAPPKRVVVVSARIHPGETPASFIVHGLVDFLTSQDPRAQLLRDHVVFKVDYTRLS